MLHEIFHLSYFMDVSGADLVVDLSINFFGNDDDGNRETKTERVYGPLNVKMMARYQEYSNVPIGRPVGDYVRRNADNLAYFATASYVQDRIGYYPHLPIVYRSIDGPPIRDSAVLTTYDDNHNPIFNLTDNSGDISLFTPVDDALPDEPSCPDYKSATSQTFDNDTDTTGNSSLNITGMANNSLYPTEYIANVSAWIKADFDDEVISSSIPSTTTISPTGTPTCVGNQVESNCIAATLPSATPFSGPQGPSCAAADGGQKGTSPRLNATVAQEAASQYCQNLIDAKIVLSESGTNPKPGTEIGKAENGADMVLTVMFDKTTCPVDQSASELDFAAIGLDACYDLLCMPVEEVCSQDSTWPTYDAEWSLEGGVYGDSCGLFALYGQ